MQQPSACVGSARVFFDPSLVGYDFGPGHPLAPIRLELTMQLAQAFGVFAQVTPTAAAAASADLLATVHSPELIEAVTQAGHQRNYRNLAHGLGTSDNPTFLGIDQAAAQVVGATVAAAQSVWRGEVAHAVNIAGGLHHAMPNLASGFCVYNDIAVAIKWLLKHGAERVAYVDVDVHHGDGVQAIFENDPRVLTISLHESGRTLFPGTGFADEIGGPQARGSAANVALPIGTTDAQWLRAFDAVVPPLLRSFAPQILVTQHGCDSHFSDPLAHLGLSVDGQRAAYLRLHNLAHELTSGRWVATGGGGYSLIDVVPRAWAHLLAIVTGRPIDPQAPTPAEWLEYVVAHTGHQGPRVMTDGPLAEVRPWPDGIDLTDPVDQAILATLRCRAPRVE